MFSPKSSTPISSMILASFLILPFWSFSQWEKLEMGEGADLRSGTPYPVIDAEHRWYFPIGDTSVAIKLAKGTFHIQSFDHEGLEQAASRETELPENKMVFNSVIEFGGSVHVLYNWWDEENKKERLFARRVDPKTASLEAPEKILEVDGKVRGDKVWVGFLQRARENKFEVHISESGDQLLVTYSFDRYENGPGMDKKDMGFTVLNEDLEKVRSKKATLPYPEVHMDPVSYVVPKSGTIHGLAEVSDTSGDGEHYELLRLEKEAKGFSTQRIELKERSLRTISIFTPPEGGLLLSGTYTPEGKSHHVKGFFSTEVKDRTLGPTNRYPIPLSKMILFEPEEKRSEFKEKGREHEDVGPFSLEEQYVHYMENGDRILVAEEFFYSNHTSYDMKRMRGNPHTLEDDSYMTETETETYAEYNDLFVIRFSKEGELKWMKVLPKRQLGGEYAENPDLSYKVVDGDQELHLLIMDHEKNLELSPDEEPEYHVSQQGGILTSYSLNKETGDITKNALLDIHDLDLPHILEDEVYQFGLDRTIPLGKGGFAFEVYKKEKEDILIGVELEK